MVPFVARTEKSVSQSGVLAEDARVQPRQKGHGDLIPGKEVTNVRDLHGSRYDRLGIWSIALAASFTLASCGMSKSHGAHTTSPVPSCAISQLRVHGGRQGSMQAASGTVVIQNVGATCELDKVPSITLISVNGQPLNVHAAPLLNSPTLKVNRVQLRQDAAAEINVLWSNWCGAKPGQLMVRLRFAGGTASVQGPFNGPPDYNYVPVCTDAEVASTVSVANAYLATS